MTQACNKTMAILDVALEDLKNREIEVGSAAFFRAYGEFNFLLATVELQEEDEYERRLERVLLNLVEAQKHYSRVLAIVEPVGCKQEYVDWLKRLDYDRFHRERIAEGSLPDESATWKSIVKPNRDDADPVAAFKLAFLERLDALTTTAREELDKVRGDSPYSGVSMVPKAFWRLQTMFTEVSLAGLEIATLNAVRPGDPGWLADIV